MGYDWNGHGSYRMQVLSADVFMSERKVGDTANSYTNYLNAYYDCWLCYLLLLFGQGWPGMASHGVNSL